MRKSVMAVWMAAVAVACVPASVSAPAKEPAPAAPVAVADVPDDLLPTPLADDPLGVTVHALRNGMRVYISPDHTKPVVDARVLVRAGSRHETDDATGLAHYLEHMLFKGTNRLGTRDYEAERPHLQRIAELYDALADASDEGARQAIFAEIDTHTQATAAYVAPNEISWLMAAIGAGEVNAGTAKDSTRYLVDDLPVNHLRTWAELEAERFREPIFRLFLPELEAVYEEKNRALDNAFRLTFKAAEGLAFGDHPYSRPSLGTAEHLRTPAYRAMVDFYDKWYVPGNMVVVLVGDVEPSTALPILEDTLGRLPARDVPPQPHDPVHPSADRTRVVKGDDAAVLLSFTTTPAAHEDTAALAVMSQIFSDGDNGLLERHLVRDHEVAAAGAWHLTYREGGAWMVHAAVRPDQTHAEVVAKLQGVIDRLRAGEFTEEDVASVQLQFEVSDMWSLESRASRMSRILESIESGATWPESVGLHAARAAVTRDEVIAVAREYLSPEVGVVELHRGDPEIPKLTAPTVTPLTLDTDRPSPFAHDLATRRVEPLAPAFAEPGAAFEARTLPGGPYIAVRNVLSDLAVVQYSFEYGQRDDPLICPSIDAIASGGTATRTATELRAELSRLGVQPWIYCSEDTIGMGFVGLDRNLEASAALIEQWIATLAIDDQTVHAMTHSAIEERKDDYSDAEVLHDALTSWALLGEHSPYLTAPSNAALAKLDAAGVRRRVADLLRRPHHTLYYGPHDAAAAGEAIALPAPDLPVPERTPRRYVPRDESVVFLVDKTLAKSVVEVTHALPAVWDSRDARTYLYDRYYGGGMAGLLFQEVREARALAYTVGGGTVNPERAGDDVRAYMDVQTAADKTTEALQILLEIAERPVGTDRFDQSIEAEAQAMRRWREEPRDLPSRVLSWEREGHTADPRRARWEHLSRVKLEDLEALRTEIEATPRVVTIVGDRSKIDARVLRKVGRVRVVQPRTLFGYE